MERIQIDRDALTKFSFMYEGGHKDPLVFKRFDGTISTQHEYAADLDRLLELVHNGRIVKSQKENDTRRFHGDPELEIVSLDLNNEFKWILFNLISEEPNKKESFHGDLEVRYGKYLNDAVTYWISVEDKKRLNDLMGKLCHIGKNLRTKPKESVKMELERN